MRTIVDDNNDLKNALRELCEAIETNSGTGTAYLVARDLLTNLDKDHEKNIQAIKVKFIELVFQLTPEARAKLEGEYSRDVVVEKITKVKLDWARLEREFGRIVTQQEVWSWTGSVI